MSKILSELELFFPMNKGTVVFESGWLKPKRAAKKKEKKRIGRFLAVVVLGVALVLVSPFLLMEIRYRLGQWVQEKERAESGFGQVLEKIEEQSGFAWVIRETDLAMLKPADPNFSVVIPKIGVNSAVMANISVAGKNYLPGTWLSGWDNLHPEFNFPLNIKRSLQSVWQEYQGLGLVAGMAHAADLPRQLFLWLVDLVLPTRLIRYFYHFLMLAVGTVGMYWFLAKKVLPFGEDETKIFTRFLASVLGAGFYLLNLGTVQYFYVPYETFSHFWAFFPWQLLVIFNFLEQPRKKRWLALLLVCFLASPQAYVQTLFVVLALCAGLILVVYWLGERSRQATKKVLAVALALLLANAYWLLPNSYFLLTRPAVTQESKINQMATLETFLRNQERGNLEDFALLKGYYYDFHDWIETTTDYFMPAWRNHFSQGRVEDFGFFLFGLVLLGLLVKNHYRRYFLVLLGLAAMALLMAVPPFAQVNDFLRRVPLLEQMFRAPFNKFVVPAIFAFSGFLALAVERGFTFLRNKILPSLLIFGLVMGALVYQVWPVFEGELFYFNLRVEIPQEYFELFEFFGDQDKSTRIANLPQLTFWGWTFYDWVGRGSGFLWYGIEQPILDRAFDVWSQEGEGYWWEVNYALKREDAQLLASVFAKYRVDWVLIDESVLTADPKPIDFDKLYQLVVDTGQVREEHRFGHLGVYRLERGEKKDFVELVDQADLVGKGFGYVWKDQQFADFGDYYFRPGMGDNYYLFPSFFSNKNQTDLEFQIKETEERLVLEARLPDWSGELVLPSLLAADNLVPVRFWSRARAGQTEIELEYLRPEIWVGGEQVGENPREKLAVRTVQPLYLAVNNRDYLEINPTSDWVEVGETYLKTTALNTINFYAQKPREDYVLVPSEFLEAAVCGPELEGVQVASEAMGEGKLAVRAKETANCVSRPLVFWPRENGLFRVSFQYQTSTEAQPQYCLMDTLWGECLNKKDLKRLVLAKEPQAVVEYMEVGEFEEKQLVFTLIVEAIEKADWQEVVYDQMAVSIHPLVAQGAIDLRQKADLLAQERILLPEGEEITVKLPRVESFYNFTQEINQFLQGKEEAVMPLPYFSQDQAYLLGIDSQTGQAMPIRFWVDNPQAKRGELDTYLSDLPQLTRNWFVLPQVNDYYEGYGLHFDNQKFGGQEGENYLGEVEISVFPLEYLKRLKVVSQEVSQVEGKQLEGVDVDKRAYWSYRVEVPEFGGLLIFSQAYADGWQAWAGKPFFGQKLEHVKVNNWANGWLLGENLGEQKIVILFWPQYLEFLGFGLLAGGLVWVWRKKEVN